MLADYLSYKHAKLPSPHGDAVDAETLNFIRGAVGYWTRNRTMFYRRLIEINRVDSRVLPQFKRLWKDQHTNFRVADVSQLHQLLSSPQHLRKAVDTLLIRKMKHTINKRDIEPIICALRRGLIMESIQALEELC